MARLTINIAIKIKKRDYIENDMTITDFYIWRSKYLEIQEENKTQRVINKWRIYKK